MIDPEPRGRVLLAGGSSPIGRSIGRELARRGHLVAVHHRTNRDAAVASVSSFVDPHRHAVVTADLLDDEQASVMVDAARTRLGGELTGLVNCAWSSSASGPIAAASAATVDSALDGLRIHLTLCRAALPSLRSAGGSIVLLGAGLVHRRHPGLGLYALSKAAAESASLTMALEEGSAGVRVNVIAPGRVETGDDPTDEDPAFASLDVIGAQRRVLPLPTSGQIASLVAFLLSSDAGALTGQVLAASGGEQW